MTRRARSAALSTIDPWFLREHPRRSSSASRQRAALATARALRALKQHGLLRHASRPTARARPRTRCAARRERRHRAPSTRRSTPAAPSSSPTRPTCTRPTRTRTRARRTDRKKIIILGGGPNRIGQGIEFDYCCVHAAFALAEAGYETIMVNCNPETVSTDYDTSDKLYFEPLTLEDVLGIVEREQPDGVIVQFGGQTPLKLARAARARRRADHRHLARRDRPRRGPRALRRRCSISSACASRANGIARTVDEAVARRAAASATRCWCGRRTCSAAARWRSSTTRTRCAATWTAPSRSARPAGARSTSSSRTPSRSTSTRSATATTSWSAASWSTSSAPACTPATAPARCRRTRSTPRCRTTIRRQTIALARELGVIGLMNVQFAVKEPRRLRPRGEPARARARCRSCRKAIGVPLAKLAARVHGRARRWPSSASRARSSRRT